MSFFDQLDLGCRKNRLSELKSKSIDSAFNHNDSHPHDLGILRCRGSCRLIQDGTFGSYVQITPAINEVKVIVVTTKMRCPVLLSLSNKGAPIF